MDFLCQAITSEVMTEEQCDEFIATVKAKGSKLPVTKIRDFSPRLIL